MSFIEVYWRKEEFLAVPGFFAKRMASGMEM